jgi:hypothetical protein
LETASSSRPIVGNDQKQLARPDQYCAGHHDTLRRASADDRPKKRLDARKRLKDDTGNPLLKAMAIFAELNG